MSQEMPPARRYVAASRYSFPRRSVPRDSPPSNPPSLLVAHAVTAERQESLASGPGPGPYNRISRGRLKADSRAASISLPQGSTVLIGICARTRVSRQFAFCRFEAVPIIRPLEPDLIRCDDHGYGAGSAGFLRRNAYHAPPPPLPLPVRAVCRAEPGGRRLHVGASESDAPRRLAESAVQRHRARSLHRHGRGARGGRRASRDFQKPLAEPVRNRWLMDSWWASRR